ncbi:hypothetical protein ACQ4PT_065315 [Festuca glaucescens]
MATCAGGGELPGPAGAAVQGCHGRPDSDHHASQRGLSAEGSLLDLFRGSFRDGEGIAHLLNHTLIVAVDPGAMARCEAVHPHCYVLEVTAAKVSSANRFMSKSFIELVWAKLSLQQRVLQLGYNYLFTPPVEAQLAPAPPHHCRHCRPHVLAQLEVGLAAEHLAMLPDDSALQLAGAHCPVHGLVPVACHPGPKPGRHSSCGVQDVDIVWFRDPFRHISLYADLAISTDFFSGDPDDAVKNAPNTGFYYVKSTNRTVEMLRRWRAARSLPRPGGGGPTNDQGIFNEIKAGLVAGELRIRLVFLDTVFFDSFCRFHGEMDKVCTMHANCCIGLETKVHDLRNVVADWKNYSRLTPPEKMGSQLKWREVFDTYHGILNKYGEYLMGIEPKNTKVPLQAKTLVRLNNAEDRNPNFDYTVMQPVQHQNLNQTKVCSALPESYQEHHGKYKGLNHMSLASTGTGSFEIDHGQYKAPAHSTGEASYQSLHHQYNITNPSAVDPNANSLYQNHQDTYMNNLFMITGRYAHGNDGMFNEAEASEQWVDKQGSYDSQFDNNKSDTRNNCSEHKTFHGQKITDENEDMEGSFCYQFGTNTSDNNTYNNSEEGQLTEEELEDPSPKYDLFGDDAYHSCDEIIDDGPQDPSSSNNNVPEVPVEHLTEHDIQDFLDNEEDAAAVRTSSQEVRAHHTPHIGMIFDCDDAAHKFFNDYASICSFSIRKSGNYHARKEGSSGHTRLTIQCNRSGKPVDEETLEAKRKEKQKKRQEKAGSNRR